MVDTVDMLFENFLPFYLIFMFLFIFRRLLQMGIVNAALLNNLGLCCFHAQQYHVALAVFRRALVVAEGEDLANVWYNLSHVAVVST